MAHTSLLFIAITSAYFIALTCFIGKIKRPQIFAGGLLSYAFTIGMIGIGVIGQSIAVESDQLVAAHLNIWINGLSWLTCGSAAILLLASFLPPVIIQGKEY